MDKEALTTVIGEVCSYTAVVSFAAIGIVTLVGAIHTIQSFTGPRNAQEVFRRKMHPTVGRRNRPVL